MVDTEGLYDRGYLVEFSSGEIILQRNFIKYQTSSTDTIHTIKEGEDLYIIARNYYGASSLWFIVADVNPIIDDIFNLTVGQSITIPNLAAITGNYGQSE